VETWLAEDYHKKLNNAAKQLGMKPEESKPLQIYQSPSTSSMGHKVKSIGHGALSLGKKAKKGVSNMASWAARLARKHLQSSKDCPICEPGGYSKAYIKQAIAKCQEEKTCVKKAKDTKIVDVMIRPSPFKPFYSVTVYENPPGQAASQVVAAAATVAAPGFHGPVQSKESSSAQSKTASGPEGAAGQSEGAAAVARQSEGAATANIVKTKPPEPAEPPPPSGKRQRQGPLDTKMITQLPKLASADKKLASTLSRTPGGGTILGSG